MRQKLHDSVYGLFENSYLLVFSLMMVSVCLKYRFLFTGSLWFDEAYGVYISSLSISELLHKLTFDYSPPLFYLILHGWIKLFGDSDIALRVLPLSIHLLTIPVVFWVTCRLFGRVAAVVTTLIVSMSGLTTYYAVEVRMYSLVYLLGIINTFFFLKLFEGNRRDYTLGFIVSTALGLYTHHSFGFVIISQLVFIGWRLVRRQYTSVGRWFISYIVVTLLYLPGFFTTVVHQLGRLSSTMDYTKQMGVAYSLGEYFVVLFSNIFFYPYLSYSLGLSILVGVLYFLYVNYRAPNSYIEYLLLLLLIPSLFLFMRTQNTVAIRYILISTFALSTILGVAVQWVDKKIIRVCLVGLIFLVAIVSNYVSFSYKEKGFVYQSRKYAHFLDNHHRQADAIVVVSGWIQYPLERYFSDREKVIGFEPESLIEATRTDEEVMITHVGRATVNLVNARLIHQFIDPYDYVWFYNPESFSDPRKLVLGELLKCHELLETVFPEDLAGESRTEFSQAYFYYFKVNHECESVDESV